MNKKAVSILLSFALILNFAIPFLALADQGISVTGGGETAVFDIAGNNITSALKNAFAFCSSATSSERYTIKVPKGTYFVSNALTVSNFTTLDLTDEVTLVDNNSNIFISKKNVTGYNGTTDFNILGGTLTYQDDYSGKSCLIRLAHAKNIKFKDTAFLNNNNSHHIEVAACKNVIFENCIFEGQKGSLLQTSGEALQIDILEDKQHFQLMPEYDGTMNDGITVNNCTFKNLLRGVGTHSAFVGYYQNRINITNSVFDNISSTAITCVNYVNSSISNNKITNCGEGIHYYMMLSDSNLGRMCVFDEKGSINNNCKSTISNNNISVVRTADTPNASSIYIFGNNVTANKNPPFKAGDYFVGNISVISNTVSTQDYGIRAYDVRNSVISKNTINGKTAFNGVFLDSNSDSNKISSNRISGFETAINIKNSSDSNVISSNEITSSLKHGILVQSGCKSNSISLNKITSCGENGILLKGAKSVSVTSNSITSSKKHGVCVMDSSELTSLSKNTITKSSSNGVYLEAKSNITNFKSNNISSCKNNGLSSYGAISKVSSNTFKSNAFGMYFAPQASASVYNNTYASNKKGSSYSAGSKKSYSFSNLSKPSVTLSQKSKTATIKWKKVKNATSYQIYRSTSKDGTYSKLATVKSGTLSYKNKKLKKGKKYYYKVRAVRKMNSITSYSSYSSVKNIKIK